MVSVCSWGVPHSVLVLGVMAVAVAVAESKTTRALMQEHLAEVFDFPCEEPQRRSLLLTELEPELSTGIYSPPMTVLHRCESAGCCQDGQVCGPGGVEDVTRVFMVTSISGPNHHKTVTYESFTFTNHTHCVCQSAST